MRCLVNRPTGTSAMLLVEVTVAADGEITAVAAYPLEVAPPLVAACPLEVEMLGRGL